MITVAADNAAKRRRRVFDIATSKEIKQTLETNHFQLLNSITESIPDMRVYRPISFNYFCLGSISGGAFGNVVQIWDRQTEYIRAAKLFNLRHDGIGLYANTIREMKYLGRLNHENIVTFREICLQMLRTEDGRTHIQFCMVLDFAELCLDTIIKSSMFGTDGIKCIMFQLLTGVEYLHRMGIIHSDLKPRNILVNRHAVLKICGFGHSSTNVEWNRQRKYCENSNLHGSLWYNPPEQFSFYNSTGTSFDMWSMGCILGELFNKCPILCGTDSEDQFLLSVRLCGTQEITPDLVSRIPKYSICVDEHCVPRTVPYRIFINLPAQWAEDLFCQMMVLDPNLRLTAQEALRHPCFSMAGRDADKHELQVVVNTFVNRVYPYRMKCLCLPPKHHPLYYYPYLAGAF